MSTTQKIDLNAFVIDDIYSIISEETCSGVLIDLISTDESTDESIEVLEIAVLPSMWVVIPDGNGLQIETLEGLNLNEKVMSVLQPLLEYCFSEGIDDAPHLNAIQNMYDKGELDYGAFVPASTLLYYVMELVDESNDPI